MPSDFEDASPVATTEQEGLSATRTVGTSPPDAQFAREKPKVPRTRRGKYIARACVECQLRKVKCSGENVCLRCRERELQCCYSQAGRNTNRGRSKGKRKRWSTEYERLRTTSSTAKSATKAHISSNDHSKKSQARIQDTSLKELVHVLKGEINSAAKVDEPHRQYCEFQSSVSNVEPSSNSLSNDMIIAEARPGSTDQLIVADDCNGETDTYEANPLPSQNVSLGSQLRGLRRLLGLGSNSTKPVRQKPIRKLSVHLELPDTHRLRHLLDVYFREFDSFLPYLDQNETERRLYDFLNSLEYSDDRRRLPIEDINYPLAALLCNIIAVAECMDPQDTANKEARPGWTAYSQGCKMIQRCSSLEVMHMDVVRYYAVGSGYLMHSECLRASLHAISLAIQVATRIKLNDQNAWPPCSEQEIVARKKLWWTIYFMDRRISQKNGTPYLIRDTEVGVDDFKPKTTIAGWNLDQKTLREASNLFIPLKPFEIDYLQSLVDLGKIWAQIWDQFFAVNAPNLGDWQEIEIMDVRIKFLERQLPASLLWNQELVSQSATSETESRTRLRLATLTRINTIRLIIRQNPLLERREDLDTKQFCAKLASATIDAIAIFNRKYPCKRSSAYFITASLVECICQLVPLLQAPCLQEEKAKGIDSFRTAYGILADLARTLSGAKRAVKALKNVFSVDESVAFFKTVVAEEEQAEAIAENMVQLDSPQATQGLDLPMSIEALQWPSNIDFFSLSSGSAESGNLYQSPTPHHSTSCPQSAATFDASFFNPRSLSDGGGPCVTGTNHVFDCSCESYLYSDTRSRNF